MSVTDAVRARRSPYLLKLQDLMHYHRYSRVFQHCYLVGGQEILNSVRNFPRRNFRIRLVQKSARPLQSTQQISVQNIKLSMFHANFPSFLCLVIIGERMIAPMKYRNLQLALIAVPHRNHARDRGRGVVTLLVMG